MLHAQSCDVCISRSTEGTLCEGVVVHAPEGRRGLSLISYLLSVKSYAAFHGVERASERASEQGFLIPALLKSNRQSIGGHGKIQIYLLNEVKLVF